ncbi:MAG: Peroxiredoxin [Mucilaginibacter sp.]|nr:Peroxiredoxin [Mucilaginibacter sp.]
MKKSILFLFAALPLSVLAQQKFTIVAKLHNLQYPAHAYVYYSENGGLRFDSTTVVNDQFTLKGTASEPMKAFVLLFQNNQNVKNRVSPDQIGVYLENGVINISSPDSLVHAKVSGTKLNADQQELMAFTEPLKKEEAALNTAYKNAEGNDELQVKIKEKYEVLAAKREKLQITFIKSHTNSVVSLNLIRQAFDPIKDLPKARMLFNSLSPEIRSLRAAVKYSTAFEKAKDVNVGAMAPDFSMKNTKDEMVSLSSFKGKYVLLDFWASWCAPCRAENPNVIKAYNQYKDKNFTVLGISLDGGENGRQKWLDAIQKDGLPYEQLSDLQGNNNAASHLYMVSEIPSNILIDPSGKIIAKNLRGAALAAKLAEVLPKS